MNHADLQIAIVPFQARLGDIAHNARAILSHLNDEKNKKTDLVIFPELTLSGYYVRDLYWQKNFLSTHKKTINHIIANSKNLPAFIIGVATEKNGRLYNTVMLIDGGKIIAMRDKYNLPQYDIFDEARYFTPADTQHKYFAKPIEWRGIKWGVMICEELWQTTLPPLIKKNGCDVMVVINASPFEKNKIAKRIVLLKTTAKKLKTPIIYNNMLGGFDELVLDGHNMVCDKNGNLLDNQFFTNHIMRFTINHKKLSAHKKNPPPFKPNDQMAQIFSAITLCFGDYLSHNGFDKTIIGISGGIDSALSLALLVAIYDKKNIDKKNIKAYCLPSQYSSQQSHHDAMLLCENFGIALTKIDIAPLYHLFLSHLMIDEMTGKKVSLTAQNLQARIRGVILMASANQHHGLLLATGNKSELATGYSTLYGDSCGGFNLLKDLYKKDVYQLSHWFNRQNFAKIPESILQKPPTAELSPQQKDSDTLPPYHQLDKTLEKIIENYDKGDKAIEKLLYLSEYKRNQSPPGPKLTARAFGNGWRLPITNRFNT
ncbi:MAG: NAD+ synthase [Alphaproteobacteria bacterium]